MSGGRWIEGDAKHKTGEINIAAHKRERATKTHEPTEAKAANHAKHKAIFERKCGGGRV